MSASRRSPTACNEQPRDGGYAYGDDHNTEYRIWGRYTGKKVFDPNSNMVLPEFELHRWEDPQREPRLALQAERTLQRLAAPARRTGINAVTAP
jgi:hypothetical protein